MGTASSVMAPSPVIIPPTIAAADKPRSEGAVNTGSREGRSGLASQLVVTFGRLDRDDDDSPRSARSPRFGSAADGSAAGSAAGSTALVVRLDCVEKHLSCTRP